MARLVKFLATVITLGMVVAYSTQFASANVIYTYVGPHFTNFQESPLIPGVYDNTMFVTGTLEFLEPLPAGFVPRHVTPLHWSFSDGLQTISDTTCIMCSQIFVLSSFPGGDIAEEWDISVESRTGTTAPYFAYQIQTRGGNFPSFNGADRGSTTFFMDPNTSAFQAGFSSSYNHGWSGPTQVPEPASLSLLVIGLAGLGLRVIRGN